MKVKGNFINYGHYVDVHDNDVVNLSIDKAGNVNVEHNDTTADTTADTTDAEEQSEAEESEAEDATHIPECFQSDLAQQLWRRAQNGKLVDERWQPLPPMSLAEMAVMAEYIARRIKLVNKWKVFAELWGKNSETLRSAYDRAMRQKKSMKFLEKVRLIMR